MRVASTQDIWSTYSTIPRGPIVSRKVLMSSSPTPGVAYIANVWATIGSASPSEGSAASTSTSAAMRSGAAAASRIEIAPPIEFPARTTGPSVVAAMKSSRSSWFASIDDGRCSRRVRPWPARSGASTRPRSVRSGAASIQFSADPPRPCRRTNVASPRPSHSR